MAADGTLLQGEIGEDNQPEGPEVERLLAGFFRALLEEQARDLRVEAEGPRPPSQDGVGI